MTEILSALLFALQLGGAVDAVTGMAAAPTTPQGHLEGRISYGEASIPVALDCDGKGNCQMLLNGRPSAYQGVSVAENEDVLAYANKVLKPVLPDDSFTRCYDLGNPIEGQVPPLHNMLCRLKQGEWAALLSSSQGEYLVVPLHKWVSGSFGG